MKYALLIGILALFLTACAGDQHVSGRVTDVRYIVSTYPCTKGSGKHTYTGTCIDIDRDIVVNGQVYTYDSAWTQIEKGDQVSFDYSVIFGITSFKDGTQHDDFPWWTIIVGLVVMSGGGIYRWKYWRNS